MTASLKNDTIRQQQTLKDYIMKLNENTKDILKNFSEINTNILIKEGTELSTISTMRNIFAKATISESFEKEFGIYDLNEFLSVEQTEDLETAGGYAKEASDEYKNKQAEMMRDALKKNDVVICTALIPGKPAPRILTEELVKLMKPGSIIFDLAAEQGGNSAFSQPGKINMVDGIKIIGVKSLMNSLPLTASSLYAKNLFSFIRNLYSKDKKDFNINLEDEIIEKSLIKEI